MTEKDHRFDDPRSEAVQMIPLRELRRAPWNARKTFDAASIAELRASIEQHGVQVPLIVRASVCCGELTDPAGGYYEIVAGHRRFEAALKGGVKSGDVPCIVRELDDAQAREIGLVDNLQREDVPPMEEALAFAELLTALGSVAAVAARVGKEQGYVAKRLKLASCSPWVADALHARLITVDHALLLARLGADEQDAALKWTLDRSAGVKTPVDKVIEERRKILAKQAKEGPSSYQSRRWEPESVVRLKGHIEHESGTALDRAPWNLETFTHSDVGPCAGCPQNTSANAPLFGDLMVGEAKCTDGLCFRERTAAWVRLQARIAMEKQPDRVLLVSWMQASTPPRFDHKHASKLSQEAQVDEAQTFRAGQWIVAPKSKSCPQARWAITVDWLETDWNNRKLRKPGELLKVCVHPECKVHEKAYRRRAAEAKGARTDPEKEKRDRETLELREKHETAIRAAIWAAMIPKLDAATAVRMLADDCWNAKAARVALQKEHRALKLSDAQIDVLLALDAFRDECAIPGSYYMQSAQHVREDRKKLWEAARSVGVDAGAIAAEHFAALGGVPAGAEILCPEAQVKAKPRPTKKSAARKPAQRQKGGAS